MQNLNWDDLLDDIEEQSAVLLLGHGFVPEAQTGLTAVLNEKLGDQLLHAYEQEGLFLFSDNGAKTQAQKETSRYYRALSMDGDMLKKIVEMPFRLIISANPDKLLPDAFTQYRLPFQFDYYSSRPKEGEYEISRPNKDKPLIFNLCGSHEDRESLLLDYDDLFLMLKQLLNDLNVPLELRAPLQKTTSYIFVGFEFERWYTQLFMRYLNMNENRFSNNSSNYVLKTSFSDADAQQFFLEQFNVKFIGADWDFYHELHKRFSEKYPQSLRTLTDTLSPTAATIVQLIEKAGYLDAFQMMKIFSSQLDEDDLHLLTMTEAEYSQHEKLKADGTSTQENLGIMLARVRLNLIELAQKLS